MADKLTKKDIKQMELQNREEFLKAEKKNREEIYELIKEGITKGEQPARDEKNIRENLPLNGNVFEIRTFIQSIQQATANSPYYLIFLFEYLNYFAGLWDIEGDDDLKEIWPEFIYTLVIFGNGAIKRNNNDGLDIFACYNTKINGGGNIVSAEGSIFNPFVLAGGFNPTDSPMKVYKLNKMNTAFFKWGVSGLTFLFTLNPFITEQIKIWTYATTNHNLVLKRFIYTVNNQNPENISLELLSMTTNSSPFTVKLGRKISGDKLMSTKTTAGKNVDYISSPEILKANEIEESKLSQLSQINEDAHNNYNYLTNLVSKMIGRPSNISFKTERNIKGEVDINNAIFEIITKSFEVQIQKGIDNYNRLNNKNAKLVRTIEYISTDEEQQPNNNEENNNA